ncbi:MAG: hypothetical protein RJA22_2363 [Verrucomicrobiota bacterium]
MSAPSPAAAPPRLLSLDALRGFDMFWIMGGDGLARALQALGAGDSAGGGPAWLQAVARQLEHVAWAGFRFYDLIFPLFVFIAGVSLVFSLGRLREREGRPAAARRLLVRSLLLFGVALLYSGGFSQPWPDIRLLGVLNRIALCYAAAGLLFLFLRPRGLAAAAAVLLAGYWALMTFVPYPDLRPVDAAGRLRDPGLQMTNVTRVAELNWATTNTLRGVQGPGLNLANYVDARYLPGKKWDGTWDPEGLLSTLPAIGTCLLGVLAGILLSQAGTPDGRKVAWLAAAGGAALVAGYGWGLSFPVVKKIWTSSFVLVAAGWSALLLAIFHHVIEVRQWRGWCQPFVWYGSNAITVYLADNLLNFRRVATRFLGGDVQVFFDTHVARGFGDLMLAAGEIGVGLALVWFLYRRRLFLRL